MDYLQYFLKTNKNLNLKINEIVKSLDYNEFNNYYKKNYFKHFKNEFISDINDFLDINFENHHIKLDIDFFKRNALNKRNWVFKRLFIVIWDNIDVLKECMNKIIFKILFCYENFIDYYSDYNNDGTTIITEIYYYCLENKPENYIDDCKIFKQDNSYKIEFIDEFKNNLDKYEISYVSLEHLNSKNKNKLLYDSYYGYFLLKIIINYLKIEGLIEHNFECDNYKIFIRINILKYLDENNNWLHIYSYLWNLYNKSNKDFKNVKNIIKKIIVNSSQYKNHLESLYIDKNNSTKYFYFKKFFSKTNNVIEEEFNDIYVIRKELGLVSLPKILTIMNFGVKEYEENLNCFTKLAKEIIGFCFKISEFNLSDCYYLNSWMFYSFDWLSIFINKYKLILNPLEKFNKLFFDKINNIDLSENAIEKIKKIDLIEEILEIFNKKIRGKIDDIFENISKLTDIDKQKCEEIKKFRNKMAHSSDEKIISNFLGKDIEDVKKKLIQVKEYANIIDQFIKKIK